MNCKIFSGLFAVVLCVPGFGRANVYENNGVIMVPPAIAPNIDATTFLNRGQFIINFTNFTIPIDPPPSGLPPYETQNTLNYSNFFGNFMSCNTGFRFENFNTQNYQRQRAANFYNNGTINCGTVDTLNYIVSHEVFYGTTNIYVLSIAGTKLLVNASNIVNSGAINLGFESLLTLKGNSVDLTRSSLTMEPEGYSVGSGANMNYIFNQGIFDGYWGIGDVNSQRPVYYPGGIVPAFHFEGNPVITPVHPVTDRGQTLFSSQTLFLQNPVSYVLDETDLSTSNRFVRAVFINNTNSDVQANVYFPFAPDIAIEFTNRLGGFTNNGHLNNLYLFDYFGVNTNRSLMGHGFANGNTTFIPNNFLRDFVIISGGGIVFGDIPGLFFEDPAFVSPLLGTPAVATPIPPGTFTRTAVTNEWAAYKALIRPLSLVLEDNFGQDPTNVPGRVEIVGDNYLDLTRARISSLNYLLLKATNHFAGSSKAQISAPVVDLNLRSTNGLLAVTNLLSPVPHRPEGDVSMYAARWTNVTITAGIPLTNRYHVLVADARFAPTTKTRIQDLILRSTNGPDGGQIVINDNLEVTRSFLLESSRITIATNAPGSLIPAGSINLVNSSLVWPTATPRLQYLTNNGVIQSYNAMFLGGSRSSPYYSSNYNEPYIAFVNRGAVTNFSSLIWASTFLNSGIFYAGGGSIELQQAQTAALTDGAFLAPAGDVSIGSGSLLISNHVLQAGSTLTLSVTNYLDDGSLFNEVAAITNKNSWSAGYGFNLLTRPSQASLLGTTISATAPALRDVVSRWPAADLGCSTAGFNNNAGLGRLILDGGDDSLFTFLGTGANNAIYVDYLELRNFATNRDGAGDFIGLNPESNMKIYFAQAVANGVSIAEKLDGKNGGRFCWVTSYTGFYSSTNLIYPDGTTNTFNAALVSSCNLDSDGDGLVNCADPTPILRPQDLVLKVSVTNAPTPKAEVSWQTGPFADNYVYYKDALGATNWQLLTNFVSSPTGGRMSVVDPINPASPRYYRVRVDPSQP